MNTKTDRTERLSIVLSNDELTELDDFRFEYHLPSRSAALRELLSMGLVEAEKRRHDAARQ
jgi:metal-responsive CopG/Arc/MetJ family transcriptional regulator